MSTRSRVSKPRNKPGASIKGKAVAARPQHDVENTDDPRGQFGLFLRAWLETHSAKDLAEELGVSIRTLQTWGKGQAGPAFQDLDRIAAALGYSDWSKLAAAIVRHLKK